MKAQLLILQEISWPLFDAVFIGSFSEVLHAVTAQLTHTDNTAKSICHKAHVFVRAQADGRK